MVGVPAISFNNGFDFTGQMGYPILSLKVYIQGAWWE